IFKVESSLNKTGPGVVGRYGARGVSEIVLGCLLWLPPAGEAQAADTLKIQIDSRTSFQTIDGFGASDAWQCQFVGENWPLDKRDHIADLLFSRDVDPQGNPKGIGLSIWRFN